MHAQVVREGFCAQDRERQHVVFWIASLAALVVGLEVDENVCGGENPSETGEGDCE